MANLASVKIGDKENILRAERLQYLYSASGISSYKELAEKLSQLAKESLHSKTVNNWFLSGNITFKFLPYLAQIFNCSVEYLVNGYESPTVETKPSVTLADSRKVSDEIVSEIQRFLDRSDEVIVTGNTLRGFTRFLFAEYQTRIARLSTESSRSSSPIESETETARFSIMLDLVLHADKSSSTRKESRDSIVEIPKDQIDPTEAYSALSQLQNEDANVLATPAPSGAQHWFNSTELMKAVQAMPNPNAKDRFYPLPLLPRKYSNSSIEPDIFAKSAQDGETFLLEHIKMRNPKAAKKKHARVKEATEDMFEGTDYTKNPFVDAHAKNPYVDAHMFVFNALGLSSDEHAKARQEERHTRRLRKRKVTSKHEGKQER